MNTSVCLLFQTKRTVDAQFSFYKRNIFKSSTRSTGMARNRWLTMGKPSCQIALVLQYCVPISELHDPVDPQSQLECISPPVSRPTTVHVLSDSVV